MDLSQIKPGEKYSQTIDPTTIKEIKLENTLVNGKQYSISIVEEKMPTLPLQLDGTKTFALDSCILSKEFDSIFKEFNMEESESNISKLKDKLQKLMNKADQKPCTEMIEKSKNLIKMTNRYCNLIYPIIIEKGEMITITVSRDTLKWTYIFKTRIENPWNIMYGFTYIGSWISPTYSYFAKSDTGNTFIITRQSNQSNSNKIFKNITPTIMFTYKPIQKYTWNKNKLGSIFSNNFYQFGLSGGISLDLTNPTAMISPSIIFADNLSLNFGLVFIQKDVLNGKYKEGDRIAENLSFEQLHEKKYMPELFFSIAFRFENNIFKKTSSSDTKKE